MSEAERKNCTVEQVAAEHKATKSKTRLLVACGGTGSSFTKRAFFLLKTRQNRKHGQQFVILDKTGNSSFHRYLSRCTALIDFFQKTKVSKSIILSDFSKKAANTLAEDIATFTRFQFVKTHFNRDSVSCALMEMYQKKIQESLRLYEHARVIYRRIFSAAIAPCFIQTSFTALTGRLLSPVIGDSFCNLKATYDSVACNPRIWWFERHTRRSAVT